MRRYGILHKLKLLFVVAIVNLLHYNMDEMKSVFFLRLPSVKPCHQFVAVVYRSYYYYSLCFQVKITNNRLFYSYTFFKNETNCSRRPIRFNSKFNLKCVSMACGDDVLRASNFDTNAFCRCSQYFEHHTIVRLPTTNSKSDIRKISLS